MPFHNSCDRCNLWTMKSHLPLRVLIICAGIFLHAEITLACHCGYKPTVLDAYEKWDVVMIGRVRSINPADYPAKVRHFLGGVRAATVVVEKIYKGNVRAGDEILIQQGGGSDCGMMFGKASVGERVLFYIPDPKLEPHLVQSVSFCERSGPLSEAKEDLVYLNKIHKVRAKTRVSGIYGMWTPDFERANKKIRLVGEKKTYEIKTDNDGFYEIYDLPPGNYRLEPEIPAGWKIAEYAFWWRNVKGITRNESSATSLVFTLAPQKHASFNIAFERDK